MDGFDLATRLKIVRDSLTGSQVDLSFDRQGRSKYMAKFVLECQRRGLPLNIGKSVMQDTLSTTLGGELDRVAGVIMHARDRL